MSNSKDQLSLDNLGDVLEELYEVNIKWYNMGLRLGLQSSCLDRIRVASTHDPADCFREMLKEWFKHCRQECSWLALVLALRSSAVGESSLARRMEKKYCNDSFTDASPIVPRSPEVGTDDDYSELRTSPMTPSTCNSDGQSSDTSTSHTRTNRTQSFGCGCGNCSLNNFLDGRCPRPKKSLSSFPYLKTSGLKESEILILKGRLYEEFALITREFSKFNTAICESLIDREIPVQKITRVLRDLRAFSSSFSNAPLLGSCWPSITASKTIDNIFNILADYVSFFNFQITDHIVDVLGTASDKLLLCEYREKVDEYCKRNIFECPSYSTLCHEEATLILKVEGIEKYNMKHLAGLVSHVSKALLVTNHTLKLCSVEEGCVKLNFQVPQCINDKIFPLNVDRIGRLMNIGKLMEMPVYISLVKCVKWLYNLSPGQTHATQGPTMEKSIYNHGLLSRTDAEQILNSVEYDCFLIRESIRHNNHVIYSFKQKGKCLHSILEHKGGGSYGPDGEHEAFPSLEFFISHGPQVLCLMPFPAEDSNPRQRTSSHNDESEERSTMSDYPRYSDNDNTGYSSGTGDSAIVVRCKLPFQKESSSGTDRSVKDKMEDCTGTGDYTGTGDSAIGLGCKLPSDKQSRFQLSMSDSAQDYQKLMLNKLDKAHTYSSINKGE